MKTPDTAKAMPSAQTQRNFTGTSPARQQRAIAALLRGPVSREQLDTVTGQSNSPELVAELRRQGLDIPCDRIACIDRDGKVCRPGIYTLTTRDRLKLHQSPRTAPAPGAAA